MRQINISLVCPSCLAHVVERLTFQKGGHKEGRGGVLGSNPSGNSLLHCNLAVKKYIFLV